VSIVTLVSGGLDSTLVAALAAEAGQTQYPLFIDYGQKAHHRELAACRNAMERLGLPEPMVAALGGFGVLIRSGLTDPTLDVVQEAFTPGRNALFLLLGASYALTRGACAVAIGLLDERHRLFPDQSRVFLESAQVFLYRALGQEIAVVAPLMRMTKANVVQLASERGLLGYTYSCHEAGPEPCGRCIACREFEGTEA
jgi:7-cyano-7-deazaguanine synthase